MTNRIGTKQGVPVKKPPKHLQLTHVPGGNVVNQTPNEGPFQERIRLGLGKREERPESVFGDPAYRVCENESEGKSE